MSERSTRLEWIDAVRALSVVCVVLLHFQVWLFAPTAQEHPVETQGWGEFSALLVPFRMPVLFAIAGMLVADRVRRGWSDQRNAVRAASSFYLYLVWLVIYALLAWILRPPVPTGIEAGTLLRQLLVPQTPLWFILFLAVNVVLLTSLHRVPPPVVLAGLAALSVWTMSFDVDPVWELTIRGVRYMLFFAIGVFLRAPLARFARITGIWWKGPVVFVLLALTFDALAYVPFRGFSYFGLMLARDVLAVLCAVAIAALLVTISPVSRFLSYLGRRTLMIYVLHVPVLWLEGFVRDAVFGGAFDSAASLMLGPAVGTVVTVALSVLIGEMLERTSAGRSLFRLPRALQQRVMHSAPRA